MSKYKGQHGGKKGEKIRARPSPPPFSGNSRKKSIFVMGGVPLINDTNFNWTIAWNIFFFNGWRCFYIIFQPWFKLLSFVVVHWWLCLPWNDNGFLLMCTAVDNWPGNKLLCAPIIGSQQGIRTERGQQTNIFGNKRKSLKSPDPSNKIVLLGTRRAPGLQNTLKCPVILFRHPRLDFYTQ